jgi:hypothetical protein
MLPCLVIQQELYSSSFLFVSSDAVVGLATVFIFIEEETSLTGISDGLLAALLCFFHVMVYWINLHHNLKFLST